MELLELIPSFNNYLQNEKGRTPATARRYIQSITKFFKETGLVSLKDYNDESINKMFLDMFWNSFEAGAIQNTTKGNYIAAIKAFTDFLHIKGYINSDFAERIAYPTPEDIFRDGFTETEQELLRSYLFKHLDTEVGRRNAALFLTYMATGMRVSEALSLRVGPEGFITFNSGDKCGSFELYNDDVYARIYRKRNKQRVVILDPLAVKYINNHLRKRKVKSDVVFNNIQNNTNGTIQLSVKSANNILQKICQDVGINRKITVHVFRHTAVMTWINIDGINTKKVLNMLGLKNEISLERYIRRDRSVQKIFAGKNSVLGRIKVSPKQRELEKMLG